MELEMVVFDIKYGIRKTHYVRWIQLYKITQYYTVFNIILLGDIFFFNPLRVRVPTDF